MPGLYVHRSNRLESLAAVLADVLRQPLRSVLQPEIVVVQSVGMRRWLALELANALGVTMNVQFPFPATFAHEVFRAAFPDVQKTSAFSREPMTWRIMGALPELKGSQGSEVLGRYLADDPEGLKQFQLSGQIANTFDRYLLHRTEKLVEWQESAKPESWQGKLWQLLIEGSEETNPPVLLKRLVQRISGGQTDLRRFPERISVFGISNLSPFYVHLLGAVGECVDVHLYLFEPTDQYWGDIQSQREQDRILRKHARAGVTAADLHLDSGNALLASMGKPARQFARTIQALDPGFFDERFESPQPDSLLCAIQADIFQLTDRKSEGMPKAHMDSNDRSIQVHCCHGPMREVEVLHDRLLDLLERLPDLSPKDILVMMPDVETYAPFIEAVFGAPESELLRIPFTIADRSLRGEVSLAESFLAILDFQGSRFEISKVLALLECEPLRAKFGLVEADLELIREWLTSAGVRWGVDGTHREEFGVPPSEQNSWRQGLDRLLLGYALPGDGMHLFNGLLPIKEVDASRAEMLGSFIDFADCLFSEVRQLSSPRTLKEWSESLHDLLSSFFAEDDRTVEGLTRLRSVLTALSDLGAVYEGPVSFKVMHAQFTQMLADSDSGFGFLAGYTTFCSLRPMRSIPFRVICVLGLNDTAFPRSDASLTFDLIAQEPQPGDRSRRDDDRQLFLETLLSARETLYLSYAGLSLRDDSESPPSVVVSELLDYIDINFESHTGASPRDELLTRHRLQAFSDSYFRGDDKMFSYSFENSRAGTARGERTETRTPFVDALLTPPSDERRMLTLDQLINFLRDPSRAFVRDRLRLRLPRDSDPLEDCEPMEVGPLERTKLLGEILDLSLAGVSPSEIKAIQLASGRLPSGWQGEMEHGRMKQSASLLLDAMREIAEVPSLPPLEIDLAIDDWRITGQLAGVRPAGMLQYRGAAITPKDMIKAWVSHLALCAMNDAAYPGVTYLYGVSEGKTAKVCFGPVDSALDQLRNLLRLYEAGLTQPVPLYPKTSWAFAQEVADSDDLAAVEAGLQEALRKWEGTNGKNGVAGERDEDAVRLCCRGVKDPLDGRWQDVSRSVFVPIIRGMVEEK